MKRKIVFGLLLFVVRCYSANYDLYTAYDMDRVFVSATDKLYIDLGDNAYSSWLY